MKLNIQNKLFLAFAGVLVILVAVSVFSYNTQQSTLKSAGWVSHTNTVMSRDDEVVLGLVNMETGFRGYLLSGKDTFLEPYNSGIKMYQDALKELNNLTNDNPAQMARWAEVTKQAEAWKTEWVEKGIALRKDVSDGKVPVQQALDYEASGGGKKYMDSIRVILAEAKKAEQDLLVKREADNTAASNLGFAVIIWGTILAVVSGIFIAFFLARSMSGAAKLMTQTAEQIAQTDLPGFLAVANAIANGDLTQSASVQTQSLTFRSSDEMGDLANSFNAIIARLQETGSAFVQMTTGLRNSVSQVAESAKNVSAASAQLSNAANQAGQAVTQIATTIQQVAKGTAQQTEGITRTAHSVEEMARAIDGVSKGAQEQAQAVAQSSSITSQLSKAIQQVAGNAQAVSRDSNTAAQAARSGAVTVEDTIKGMQSIKQKVGISTQKVQEMGIRSEEIGTIVVAIEDIASQTNLLALNAAIEAARAGEHGKGFSVVADEVRKLAERASSATKEIGGLIKGIQKTVAEAVKAMEEGDREVESGVVYANQAGQVLKDILVAAEAVNQQAEQAAAASEQMSASADELVKAVDSVSAVVEENTASTEEMAAGSSEVTHAIENVASISEENSAAAEEVSASAEEMSAQVEEVSASAQSLAEMAEMLQKVVAQFKL
jgi:methyl-accepting chemotaxis protein